MTVNGWIQIGFYVAVLTALTPLLGHYMARVYTGERVFLTPRPRAGRAASSTGRSGPGPSDGQDWKSYARSVLVFSALSWLLLYLILRTAEHPAVQPGGLRLGPVGRHLQHDVVVRHQHELAVLRRRDDDLLLLADGRPRRPELPLGRRRHGRPDRRHPRDRQPRQPRPRQLLGRPHPLAALHPAAALDPRRALPRLPGRRPDARRLPRRHDARRRRSRGSRSAPPRRRWRSSSSAPTAAASSTSTRRCRSRTRRRSRTSSRSSSSS